jgi:hypothetical protein
MMYQIAEYDLEQIGRSGMGSVRCKVTGFWSGDSITLYVNRKFGVTEDGGYTKAWKITISNSSGGRDTDEVEDDMVAYKNYAAALDAMCDVGKMLRMNVAKLEASYMAQRELDRAEHEAERAAQAAAFEADERLGDVAATLLVDEMITTGKSVRAFRRADNWAIEVTIARREKTKFYHAGSIIAKKALIEKLAEYSHRTAISE